MQRQEETVAGQVAMQVIPITEKTLARMVEVLPLQTLIVRAAAMMIIMPVHVEMVLMKVEVAQLQNQAIQTLVAIIIAVRREVQAVHLILTQMVVARNQHNQEVHLRIVGQEAHQHHLILLLHRVHHREVQVVVVHHLVEVVEVAVGRDNIVGMIKVLSMLVKENL
jgi:hypothetical protein